MINHCWGNERLTSQTPFKVTEDIKGLTKHTQQLQHTHIEGALSLCVWASQEFGVIDKNSVVKRKKIVRKWGLLLSSADRPYSYCFHSEILSNLGPRSRIPFIKHHHHNHVQGYIIFYIINSYEFFTCHYTLTTPWDELKLEYSILLVEKVFNFLRFLHRLCHKTKNAFLKNK